MFYIECPMLQLVREYKDRINCVAVNSNDWKDYRGFVRFNARVQKKYDLQCEYIYDNDP